MVTVCIPAYKSAAFLAQTLRSITQQTFNDFRVLVAIEPLEATATLEACRYFERDPRFELFVNDRVYGWPGNIQNLLSRVRTSFFTVLPHDDLWHPRYLEALVAKMESRPDVVCAYVDSFLFVPPSGIRTCDLPDEDLPRRLLAFYLAGAEGFAWRGLTRREVLTEPFPYNEFNGFAVETEWCGYLLLSGRVVRHPEPLYLKRQRDMDDSDSVSVGWRVRMETERLRAALAHNRARHLEIIDRADVTDAERHQLVGAAEAAMLRRLVIFSANRFDLQPEELARALSLATTGGGDTPSRRAIQGRAELTLSRYWLQRKQFDQAFECANRAVEMAPDYSDAGLHFARLLMRRQRAAEALPYVLRAAAADPMSVGLAELQLALSKQLTDRHAFGEEPTGQPTAES